MAKDRLTFLQAAKLILEQSDGPLTGDEIWKRIVETGQKERIGTQGATPERTLWSRLYQDTAYNQESTPFVRVSTQPTRFGLKSKGYAPDVLDDTVETTDESEVSSTKKEKELHPILAQFAWDEWGARSKTINDKLTTKKNSRRMKWMHPDLVAVTLGESWEESVRELARSSGHRPPFRVLSFELKLYVDMGTLKEKYFQAISNSSWAHEGYLAFGGMPNDPLLEEEMKRLNAEFGIGFIHLKEDSPADSKILFQSRNRQELDFQTMSLLALENSDFKSFLRSVNGSLSSWKLPSSEFDPITES